MNQFLTKRRIITTLIIILGLFFIYQVSMHRASGLTATTLTNLQSIEPLRTQFNQDKGQPRLILLVSPT